MAGFNTGSSDSSFSTPTTVAEINVTPLVDVMLVLLIVFMVSAPLMQQGLQVDLPKTSATAMNETPQQLTLVIDRSKQIKLDGKSIETGSLYSKLSAIQKAKPEIQVVIQADQALSYGFVAKVMAEVKRSKIHRVGLATSMGTGLGDLKPDSP